MQGQAVNHGVSPLLGRIPQCSSQSRLDRKINDVKWHYPLCLFERQSWVMTDTYILPGLMMLFYVNEHVDSFPAQVGSWLCVMA